MPLGINRGLTQPIGSAARTAPGYRARDTGNLTYVGDSGFSWSFAGSETYSIFLNFGIQNLNPSYARYRGYGLQLRCLSE
ncbi:hypothetical protein [uncultured Rikenella sp.]|uniref:hypothetical protein n=1 Tax=uncultured Rikenella sp. TaxID=368003 RepID=UPI0025CCEA3C|nr:hypothetical protein [uncultured Rikenella sp.]